MSKRGDSSLKIATRGPGGTGPQDEEQRGQAHAHVQGHSLCRNPECQELIAEHPKVHRHSTTDCMHHKFCQESTMPAQEDKFQHKTIAGVPNEMNDAG